MKTLKYALNQYLLETFLAWVLSVEIAILEVQRTFDLEGSEIRELRIFGFYYGRIHWF